MTDLNATSKDLRAALRSRVDEKVDTSVMMDRITRELDAVDGAKDVYDIMVDISQRMA